MNMRQLRKYYRRVMLSNGSLCWLAKDGLLYLIEKGEVKEKLKDLPSDSGGIYFNESRDRYCAENDIEEEMMQVNPSIVSERWGTIEIMEE